ncbi:c-Myc-binding protein [Halyomorpha halys]|uniref:c-Myc-binding protein n=1 Tax=Halyomorpha halys TaxID=286706 RepID=UPI0006D4C6D9|nr:c-Myc-binding protein-like [Halyomorpha halys]
MDTFRKDLRRQTIIRNSAPSARMQTQNKRRKEFKEYLLETGVQSELAKCLRMLFEEPIKPRDPIDYIGKRIGPPRMSAGEYRRLHEKLQVYLHRIKDLKEELEWLQAEISKISLESDSEEFRSSILCPSPSSEA